MREVSFQARRCHLTSPTSGAASLEYPSSHPLPTTTSTPLRTWLSSSTICIRYAASLAFQRCISASLAGLLCSACALQQCFACCAGGMLRDGCACSVSLLRSCHQICLRELQPEEVQGIHRYICTDATRSYSLTPSGTLVHATFDKCLSFDSMFTRLMAPNLAMRQNVAVTHRYWH